MKITIIGSSGGGKSTLSRKISSEFSIPRFEIDRVWFKYGGHEYLNGCTPAQKEVISKKILMEIEQFIDGNESWVFDGTYSKLQPVIAEQADYVVLIQRPLHKRIFSHIYRVIKGDDRHPEVTRLQDLGFTRTLIKRWRKQEDKKLSEFVKQYTHKLAVLRNFKEVDAFFETLKENSVPSH
jgi:adenylate kinase family enzyme